MPRQTVIHREHRAQIVETTLLGVVGEPKQFGRKGILEAAIGFLIGHLQAVAPIQPRIDSMLTRALVEEGTDGLAAHLKLETTIIFSVGDLQTQAATVLVIASVVVATDVIGGEANVHAVVQTDIIHTHRIEPTVELLEVVVEAQLLLHRQAERPA